MRSIGIMADVIAVTGVRELNGIRAALSLGVIHYVFKAFTFATLAQRLQAYTQFRAVLWAFHPCSCSAHRLGNCNLHVLGNWAYRSFY